MGERAPWNIIFDSHFHLSGKNTWEDALRRFLRYFGNAINLVNLPDYSLEPDNYYEEIYLRTVKVANLIREAFKIHVEVSIGPYPLDFFYFQESGKNPRYEMFKGLHLAAKYISDGKASGFGEVGRPHFQVDPMVMEISNDVITESMMLAKDLDTYVMLHTEDLNTDSIREIEGLARKVGINIERVIKHHAKIEILGDVPRMPKTLLATRNNVKLMIESGRYAMLESDYANDPMNPDKLIPPESVPKRAIMIRQNFENYENIFQKIFQDIPYSAFDDDFFKV